MSDSTTCTACGASVPAGATFCTNCGAKVGGPETGPTGNGAPADDAPATDVSASTPTPTDDDATRVDHPGLGDATQVFQAAPAPPGPSPTAAPWQPTDAPGAPPSGPPAAAPWDPPPSAAAPPPWSQPPAPSAPPGWDQPAPPPTAAGQWGAPGPAPGPAASPGSDGARKPSPIGGLVAAVGAVLVLAGLFLPWLGNNQDNARYEASGWDLTTGERALESIDPYLVLALGIGGLVIAVLLLVGLARPIVRLAALLAGGAVVAILALDWMAITDVVADDPTVGSAFEVAAEIGFYLTIAGGIVLALAALAPAAKPSSSART